MSHSIVERNGPVNPWALSQLERERQLGPCWRALMEAPGDQTTPTATNGTIRALCRALVGRDIRPVFISSIPYGKPLNCHYNVRRYVAENGGKVQFGWLIWQGGKYVEAEPHSVVQRADGSYLCVTDAPDGERTLMFLPDPNRDIRVEEFPERPDLYLMRGFQNVPAKDPRVAEWCWLTPKKDLGALADW